MDDTFEIRHVREHYEVYINEKFYCSADTYSEANSDIRGWILMQEALKGGI